MANKAARSDGRTAATSSVDSEWNLVSAFGAGAGIGALGGLIGLGGAEFRLPILMGVFGFGALEAVILNKAMSLVVVASALPFRTGNVPWASVAAHWSVIVNLLAGSLAGAWFGAEWTTRLRSQTLYRVIAGVLVIIALVLLASHEPHGADHPPLVGLALIIAGLAAGAAIGVVAALLGVAGGELLIPTLVLLFGCDIKLAGSLSLVVSLPTMLMGFARYSRASAFAVVGRSKPLVLMMVVGSIAGSFVGAQLLGIVPNVILLPLLAIVLLISSFKVWRYGQIAPTAAPRLPKTDLT